MREYWSLTTAGLAKLKPEFELPEFNLPNLSLPKLSLAKFNVTRVEAASVSEAEFNPTLERPTPNSTTFNLAPTRLATTAGVIAICLGTVAAWHQIGGVRGSEAHEQSQLRAADAAQTNLVSTQTSTQLAIAKTASALGTANDGKGDVQAKQGVVENQIVENQVIENRELASIAAVAPGSDTATVSDQTATPPTWKTARRGMVSTSRLPLANVESGIQATRPPLRFVYPKYSEVSARGVVALTADVDATGAVRSVRVVKGNRSLAAAAISAVRKWRYRPYLRDGHPVATETNIVISFFSNDAITMSFPPSVVR
jgi:TonB family protein